MLESESPMRVVIDTNIWVSGLFFVTPHEFLEREFPRLLDR